MSFISEGYFTCEIPLHTGRRVTPATLRLRGGRELPSELTIASVNFSVPNPLGTTPWNQSQELYTTGHGKASPFQPWWSVTGAISIFDANRCNLPELMFCLYLLRLSLAVTAAPAENFRTRIHGAGTTSLSGYWFCVSFLKEFLFADGFYHPVLDEHPESNVGYSQLFPFCRDR